MIFEGHAEVLVRLVLLRQQLVDVLVALLKFNLYDCESSLQFNILLRQRVGRHPLLHDIIIETFTLLMDHSGPQLAHFHINLTLCLVGH